MSLAPAQVLLDDNRRKTMAATIEAVHHRVSKERQRKLDKGMSLADLTRELGSEEAHKKKECMKEVCTVCLRLLGPGRPYSALPTMDSKNTRHESSRYSRAHVPLGATTSGPRSRQVSTAIARWRERNTLVLTHQVLSCSWQPNSFEYHSASSFPRYLALIHHPRLTG